jgi:hypothetical protein
MDERTPTTKRGIPLSELREQEYSLRRDKVGYRTGATPVPVPIERESTGRLANELSLAAAAGGAEPINVEQLIDRLATKLHEKSGGGGAGAGGGGRAHPEANAWIRWGLGAIVLLLTAWWALGEKFAERPTVDQLREMQAPEIEQVKRHEMEIRDQRDSIIDMRGTLKTVSEGVSEIKASLKERP